MSIVVPFVALNVVIESNWEVRFPNLSYSITWWLIMQIGGTSVSDKLDQSSWIVFSG